MLSLFAAFVGIFAITNPPNDPGATNQAVRKAVASRMEEFELARPSTSTADAGDIWALKAHPPISAQSATDLSQKAWVHVIFCDNAGAATKELARSVLYMPAPVSDRNKEYGDESALWVNYNGCVTTIHFRVGSIVVNISASSENVARRFADAVLEGLRLIRSR